MSCCGSSTSAWPAKPASPDSTSGVTIDPKYSAAAERLIARQLELRVARLAFGEAAVRQRTMSEDRQLTTALDQTPVSASSH